MRNVRFDIGKPIVRPSKGVALSICRVFLRNDVAELTIVNVAVVFVASANVDVAL